jgi:maleate isomerase
MKSILIPIDHRASRGVARIGVIVPVSNTNMEPDMQLLKPHGVSIHFARAGGYDLDQVPDSEQMRKFAAQSLEAVLADLNAAQPDVVLYGCTSATLSSGYQYDIEFCQRMEDLCGVPGITAAGALVESLIDLGISRIGFCSPYTKQLNAEAAEFLENAGISVVESAYIGSDLGNYGQGSLTPEQVLELGKKADHKDADAVVLSCTDMRSVEIASHLEQTLGKPVVTSNLAMMHVALTRLKLNS